MVSSLPGNSGVPANLAKIPISPVKKKFSTSPLSRVSLNLSTVVIYKAKEDILVIAINDIVIKWFKDQRTQYEFKIHCDDVGDMHSIIPIVYGNRGKFSLRTLFHANPHIDDELLEALRMRINESANRNIINESFVLQGTETQQTLMVYPKMDGNLEELIPQLRFNKREDLITAIVEFVQKAIADISTRNVSHGDLRPRNIYFKLDVNVLKIYLADFGKARRIYSVETHQAEFTAFRRAVKSIKTARKSDAALDAKGVKWNDLKLFPFIASQGIKRDNTDLKDSAGSKRARSVSFKLLNCPVD